MADVNANISIGIDTTNAAAQLKALEAQLSDFNNRVIASNQKAIAAQRQALALLQTKIGDTGAFTTQIKNVESSVSRFSTSLEKGKLSFGEYFRYGLASTKRFGRAFDQELATIEGLAEDRVKRLSTRYISLGQDINGVHKAMAIAPTELGDGLETRLALAAQKQQIFNQLLKQGSTHLVNWGKNTQWAGRQLMVGFTVPLTIFGGVAMKVFSDLEKQTIAFQRVYGDLNTTVAETDAMTQQVKQLAAEFTKYGVSVSDTMKLAADAAATGAQGADLITQTTQATRLATLGQMDQQDALKSTIALQNAFKMSNEEVAKSVDFLNAVENQTVVSLADITQAIPRVAPVIKGLGGDVKDLAVFMAAMQEGGVGAAEAANALKSGLASLINPTKDAREALKGVGINIDEIINTNRGDLMGTVNSFAEALQNLDKTAQQQVLAKVFGKYQFARLGALFDNITKSGSQASRVMELTGMSVTDLANLSDKELGKIENAVSVKFQASIEKLKLAIAPIGEMFMKVATPIIDAATKILDVFNSMPDGVKTAVTVIVGLFAGIAPVFLMGVGLIANGLGNLIKGFSALRSGYQRMVGMVSGSNNPLTQSFGYLSQAELDAIAAGQGLDGQLSQTTGQVLIQKDAVNGLTAAYRSLIGTMASAQATNPQGFAPIRGRAPRRMAEGGMVGGKGNKDTEPTLLTPGEFVMNADAVKQFAPILIAMNEGKIRGLSGGSGREDVSSSLISNPTQNVKMHVSSGRSVQIAEALQIEGIGQKATQLLTALQDITDILDRAGVPLEQAVVNLQNVANLIAEMPADFNEKMKRGVSGQEFTSTWSAAGTEKWRTTAGLVGKDFEELEPHLRLLDTEITGITREMGVVADSNLHQVFLAAFDQLPEASKLALQDIRDLGEVYNNLRASGTTLRDLQADQVAALAEEGYYIDLTNDERARIYKIVKGQREDLGSIRYQQEPITLKSGTYRTADLHYSTGRSVARKQAETEEMSKIAMEAATVAGEKGSEAFWVAYTNSLKAQGTTIRTALAQAINQGMPANMFEPVVDGIAFDTRTRTRLMNEFTDMGEGGGRVFKVGFLNGVNAASPPPWSYLLGDWIGEGINVGVARTVHPPELSASQMRGAVMLGGGASAQGDGEAAMNLDRLSTAAGKAAVATETEAVATITDTIATEKEAVAHQENTQSITQEGGARKKGLGGFAGMLYAVDGLSLAMSFLPGTMGDFANKIFIASSALSALDAIIRIDLVRGAVTQLLKALKIVRVKQIADVGADIAGSVPIPSKVGSIGKAAEGTVAAGATAAAAETALAASAGEAAAATGTLAAGSTAAAEGSIAAGAASSALALEMTPVGWAITAAVAAIAALTAIAMPFVLTYKNLGDKIRDLGDAAELTKDQLKSLAGEFGFTQQKTGFEQPTTSAGNTIQARTTAQQANEYIANNPDMQEKSRVIGQATDQEAAATLRAMFSNLLASGAPKDVATSIIEAVAQQAGKQHVFLPVTADLQASFNDEGKIKDISKYIEGQLAPALSNVQEQIDKFGTKGFDAIFDQKAVDDAKKTVAALAYIPEALKSTVNPQYDQAKAVLDTAKNFDLLKTSSQAAMNLLSSQFVNGQISLDEFNKGMSQIETSLNGLGQPQALKIMQQQLADLYPASIEGAKGITDAADAMKVLQLAASGYDMGGFMAQIASAGAMTATLTAQLSALYSLMGQTNAARDKLASLEKKRADWIAKHTKGGGTGGGGGTPKDPFADQENKIRNEQAAITIKEVKIDRKAEGMFDEELKKRFGKKSVTIDGLKLPLNSISDAEYAIGQIGEKIDDIQNGPMQALNDKVDELNKQEAEYQKQLDAINHDIELQQQHIAAIERQYKPIIDSLNEQKDLHQSLLDQLQEEQDAQTRPIEDRIYELEKQKRVQQQIADQQTAVIDQQISALDDQLSSIDDQEAALQKVANVNQYILDQQKRQIGLAEALSSGDVYAAAAAQQEMQAASTQNAQDLQKQAFQQQRDEINKKKDAYNEEKQLIQDSLDAIQEQIDAQEYQKFLVEDTYRLRIRAEQDALAAADKAISAAEKQRDAQIAPYQAIIDNYAPQIETLNTNIWNKQKEIKDVQDSQLAPLEEQVKKLDRQKTLLEDIKGDVETTLTKEKQGLENRKKYLDQELQILQAKREMADLPTGGGGGSNISSAKVPKTTPFDKAIAKAQGDLNNLQTQIQTILDKFGKGPEEQSGWQTFLDNIVPDNWDFLMPDIDWAGVWNNMVKPFKDAWNGISQWVDSHVVQPIKNAWNGVATWVDTTVIQPIKNAWNTISENVKAVVETIAALFVAIAQLFYENVVLPIKSAWDGFWAGTIQPKIDWIASAWETVRAKFSAFIDAIKAKWDEFYANTIQPKIDWISNVWETVKLKFGGFIDAIKARWDAFYTNTIEPKINLIKDVWETVKTKFTGFVDAIKEYWNTFWTNNIQPKIDLFLSLWDNVKTAFINAFTAIGTWWDKWKAETFDEKVVSMKNALKSIFDPETWKSWFTGALSSFKGVINEHIIGNLNKVKLKLPDSVFGIPLGPLAGKEFGFDITPLNTGGVAGNGGRDAVPAVLTPGEFVIRKSMVDKYGEPMFKAINQGSFGMPSYAMPASKTDGVKAASVTSANINAPVYNTYSINVPVNQPGASADEIANKVMMKIKSVDNSSIRRINGY